MIAFISICAVMTMAVVVLIARPLLRRPAEESGSRRLAFASTIVFAFGVPLLAAVLYVSQSNWSWNQSTAVATQQTDALQMVAGLENRLQSAPNDLPGWLMLGRSYLTLDKPARAIDAYQKAYDLSGGANTEAALGLGEALALTDQMTLRGRAGELFEAVLSREPMNPTALWYGAVAALAAGKLDVARQRIANLLAQNPPQQIREILERQLQDLDQQLGQGPTTPAPAKVGPVGRTLTVKVSLAPQLVGKADPRTTVFILARGTAGPPLAVTRRTVADLPLVVTLSDADAMVAGMNLSSSPQIQVVARISKSGTPQAQSGDLYGEVAHSFKDSQSGAVDVVIERSVP